LYQILTKGILTTQHLDSLAVPNVLFQWVEFVYLLMIVHISSLGRNKLLRIAIATDDTNF